MGAINILIPDSLKARIAAQAAAEQRTIKAVVVRALEAYLAERGGEQAA